MEMLDLLKLDMANYTIQQMRPYIQQQVVTYEQKKFKEVLDVQRETGIDGLEGTRLWLARAQKRIQDDAAIGGYKTDSGATASAIANEAFMEMFVWNCEHPFPEVTQKSILFIYCMHGKLINDIFYYTFIDTGDGRDSFQRDLRQVPQVPSRVRYY
jgi:hypothetical protein